MPCTMPSIELVPKSGLPISEHANTMSGATYMHSFGRFSREYAPRIACVPAWRQMCSKFESKTRIARFWRCFFFFKEKSKSNTQPMLCSLFARCINQYKDEHWTGTDCYTLSRHILQSVAQNLPSCARRGI